MKCSIGGVYFDNVTMSEAVEAIVHMVRKGNGPHLVCTANLDHLASLRKDPEFLAVYKTADLILADGMPIVWISQQGAQPLKERVAGSDLLYALAEESADSGLRLFLMGGQPGAVQRATVVLQSHYPGCQVVGIHCPSKQTLNTPEEEAKIAALIAESKPDVLLVGFGAPKQEKWIAAHRDILKVPVSIGVGAAFDMAAGMVKRAPVWMQKSGLEWAFRLIQEPRRLWGRYMGQDLPFLIQLYLESKRQRKALQPASKPNTLL
ncbi:MAG TPA: WecB/TagA/CpsF family glycosyltransferase [Capsulimonadaceae bacterium]|jgi:N-acetylglucosaminyldiphosphoundecaprenol N-acetyl-beta-D-mannosaminyltransferase